MTRVLGSVLSVFLFSSVPAAAQPAANTSATAVDPVSLNLAHQIVAMAFPSERRPQMFNSMMDSIVEQGRSSLENLGLAKDKDLDALIDRSTMRMWNQLKATVIASLPDFFEAMSRAYARDFSRDDLSAILTFVKTPTGQRYFERAALILKDPDVQAANQRMMAGVMAQIPELDRKNKQDIQDYIANKAKQNSPVQLKTSS